VTAIEPEVLNVPGRPEGRVGEGDEPGTDGDQPLGVRELDREAEDAEPRALMRRTRSRASGEDARNAHQVRVQLVVLDAGVAASYRERSCASLFRPGSSSPRGAQIRHRSVEETCAGTEGGVARRTGPPADGAFDNPNPSVGDRK